MLHISFTDFALFYGMLRFFWLALMSAPLLSLAQPNTSSTPAAIDSLTDHRERHLRNVQQLTFGGNNAEAYWSFDGMKLIFQSDWAKINPQGCDQIYELTVADVKDSTYPYRLISTGKGRTTCSYFLKDGRRVFASTHAADAACPTTPMRVNGKYVWAVYNTFDIYITDKDGKNPQPLITGEGYDAEATASPDGRYLVYTSTRSGDLELWRYDLKTKEHLQLTDTPGYDGGAFFSPDSKQIVWRASRFPDSTKLAEYRALLAKGLVEPGEMQIFVADIDGKNVRQVTNLPGANWAPFFHPDGKRIVFSSNHHSMSRDRGRYFAVWMINVDGTGLERITYSEVFDAFPMFSPNGKYLVWASNRNNKGTRDTNVFVAEWVE